MPRSRAASVPLVAKAASAARTTREQLIDLAAEVFASEGYASASVRDLGRRLGVTSGALYGNFRGKADLLAEAVDTRLTTDLWDLPDDVVEQSLVEMVAYQFAHYKSREQLMSLLLEGALAARGDAEVRSAFTTPSASGSAPRPGRSDRAVRPKVSTRRQSGCRRQDHVEYRDRSAGAVGARVFSPRRRRMLPMSSGISCRDCRVRRRRLRRKPPRARRASGPPRRRQLPAKPPPASAAPDVRGAGCGPGRRCRRRASRARRGSPPAGR